MKKTNAEILQMIATIQEETDSLPKENIFGDSNDDDIEEASEWVRCLKCAIAGDYFTNYDVKKWLQGDHSALSDFE